MRYEMISADCHLDLCWLPPDLFTTNATAALRDRMPHVIDQPEGPDVGHQEGRQPRARLRHGLGRAASTCPGASIAPIAWPRPASTRTARRASGG